MIGTNNRLLDDGTYTYLYDDAGNRVRRTDKVTGDYIVYEWDHRSRLVGVAFYTPADVLTKRVEYDYDAFDRRIAKRVDDDGDGSFDRGTRFVYDGADVVLVFDESGSLANRYLHGPGVDQIFADEDALGEILWALTDKQGTVRDVADYDAASDTTTVVNHIQYDSFGNIISESNPAVEFLYAFTGRVWDADAELYYYRARWYDPVSGRFVSEDPIGFGGGDVNLRRYVGNSPTNGVDPSGLQTGTMRAMGKDPPPPLAPNWGEGYGPIMHSRMELKLQPDETCVNPDVILDDIWDALKDFRYFDGNYNTVANLDIKGDIGYFDTLGKLGNQSDIINDDPAAVRLSIDEDSRTITAQTLDLHPLVGIRKWGVTHDVVNVNGCDQHIFTIWTETYERARGPLNYYGRRNLGGNKGQSTVWKQYFQNLLYMYEEGYMGGGVLTAGRAPVDAFNSTSSVHNGANPWR